MKHESRSAGSALAPKLRAGAGITMLFGAIAVPYFARDTLVPFAFALTLTFLLTPAVALLQRLRAGRVLSVLATVLVTIALTAGIGWIIYGDSIQTDGSVQQSTISTSGSTTTVHASDSVSFTLPCPGVLFCGVQCFRLMPRALRERFSRNGNSSCGHGTRSLTFRGSDRSYVVAVPAREPRSKT
jgi:hypothetical protein